jgi:lipopolysaccharide transport system ATP-binding protein
VSPAVRVETLTKRYDIASTRRRNDTLRDEIALAARSAIRRRGTPVTSDTRRVLALDDVSFVIERGEVVGVVGRNGAGKSTLLKILARITRPTSGRAELWGRVGSLLEVGTGFHPELSGRQNIFLNGAVLGMRRAEVQQKFDEIVEFAEVARFIDTPVKRYSSGMYMRLAFAVAAYLDTEILLVDEVLAVGDAEFQRRCLGRISEIAHGGRTVLFVSHNAVAVSSLCTRGLLLDRGKLVADGPVDEVLRRYSATMRTSAATPLADRLDRQGSGRFRFMSVDVGGPAGPVVTGDPATFELGYRAEAPCPGLEVGIAVYGPLGEALFHCHTRFRGSELSVEAGGGTISCTIPQLPLLPGTYSFNLFSSARGEILDWIREAAVLEVGEGDYYGTGRLPEDAHGRFLVHHEWTVEQDDQATRRAVG